jgi:N-alpha-acetyl-L-2,4-diaminobutyrate deacetylase
VDRVCFTVAPFAGHYEPVVACCAAVSKGAVVGYLHDFDHLEIDPWPIRAGVDGVVMTQAWAAPVMQGQHVVVVGRVSNWLSP